jgi:hypothetical protein
VFLIVSTCAFVAAQEHLPHDYGIADTNYHYISAEEFHYTAGPGYIHASNGFWASMASVVLAQNMAPLRLPSGSLVDGYTVIFDDQHAVANLSLVLNRYWVSSPLGVAGTAQIGPTFTSSGEPGIESEWVDLDPNLTISYFNAGTLTTQSYVFTVNLPETGLVRFRGVIVHWYRQISPAPAVATFLDVPLGAFGFKHVEALAASGITAGCDATHFCPNQPITRVQMAVFLAKALGLHWAP